MSAIDDLILGLARASEALSKLLDAMAVETGPAATPSPAEFTDYQIAGSMGDYGGGNVDWWHDYIRTEIARANEHWREQVEAQAKDGGL
jgi:hypothetical protein